jgi:hydroxylamine dehydrogenase
MLLCLTAFIVLPSSNASASETNTAEAKEDKKRYELKDQIKITNKSGYCIDCHRDDTPGIYNEWINSTHARVGVGCADCHGVVKSNQMGSLHAGKFYVSTVVTPFKCSKCHKDQMRDYFTSGHAKSLELLKNMKEDDLRYPIVAQYKDDNFRQCGGCHGVEVTIDDEGKPDPATWPNSGAGRINPDKGHGTCAACHMGHRFSVAAARQPETCTRCHDGANYPEGDIYRSSAHGTLYSTQVDKKDLDRPGLFFSGKEMGSPTCAFCHFNGSGHGLLTRHNGAWRLPRDLTYPKAPLAERSENLRNNMKSVCNQCHSPRVIDAFFTNADQELEKYQRDIMEPGLAVYAEKLAATKGQPQHELLKEYSRFLAEGKRFRMNLYMGRHGRVQR